MQGRRRRRRWRQVVGHRHGAEELVAAMQVMLVLGVLLVLLMLLMLLVVVGGELRGTGQRTGKGAQRGGADLAKVKGLHVLQIAQRILRHGARARSRTRSRARARTRAGAVPGARGELLLQLALQVELGMGQLREVGAHGLRLAGAAGR